MANENEPTARMVVELREIVRAAIRSLARDRNMDMGKLVEELALANPAVLAEIERISHLRDGGGETKKGRGSR